MLIEQSDQYMGTRSITVATKDKNTMLAIMALHQNDGYFRQPEDLQDAAYLRKIAP
jgi:cytochrome c-type biogenesis protein CcmE